MRPGRNQQCVLDKLRRRRSPQTAGELAGCDMTEIVRPGRRTEYPGVPRRFLARRV